jgi:hypothetical protein
MPTLFFYIKNPDAVFFSGINLIEPNWHSNDHITTDTVKKALAKFKQGFYSQAQSGT